MKADKNLVVVLHN